MSPGPEHPHQQVVLNSGASRGIGLGMARALVRSGARVAMLARSSAALDRAADGLGADAFPVAADVTDPAAVARAVARVEAAWGPVDLLVHDAGAADVIGPLWEADPDGWWGEVTVHVRGAMLLAHACLPTMIERGSGRVVFVYGNLGDHGAPWCTAYATGKAGLLRLVDRLHRELDGTGVRVFGLQPGLVWTPMTAALADDVDKRRWLPAFGQRPRSDFGSSEPAGELIRQIADGDADPLAGLLIGVGDDLAELCSRSDTLRAEHQHLLRVQ